MQSNQSLFEKIKKELLYMGLEPEQIQQVAEPIAEDNRRSVASWSIFSSFFWIMSLLMAINSSAYAACRAVYLSALASCVVTLVGAQSLVKRFPRMLMPIIYLFELSLLGAGLGIAFCQPDVRTVTMIAFAIIAPTAFIDSSLVDLFLQGLTLAVYVVLGRRIIEPEIYSWGITNLIIFSIAGVMIGHVINKARFERYVYAESAKRLAEIQTRYAYYDQLTGLKNRRAYVEELNRLAENMPEDLCVVMADLNGLKQANDTLGHEAGDALIVGAADCLRAAFEKIDTIFRIGGDEFCVLLPGTPEKAEGCLERLKEISARWSGHDLNGVSIACGLASTRDSADIEQLVTQADQKMYEQKREYYLLTGIGR